MSYCLNCGVEFKINNYQSNNQKEIKFNFQFTTESDQQFFTQEQKNKYLDWEKEKVAAEEKRKQGYYGYGHNQYQGENPHKTITRSYCQDCARAIKKIKIKGYNTRSLEPELEELKASLNELKSTIQSKDDMIIDLLQKNTKMKQELVVKEVTKTYALIEQQK